MNKKLSVIILVCSLTLAVVGIILIFANGTPYLVCKQWLNQGSLGKYYTYALAEFPTVQAGFFGGITLTALGGIGFIVSVMRLILEKKREHI